MSDELKHVYWEWLKLLWDVEDASEKAFPVLGDTQEVDNFPICSSQRMLKLIEIAKAAKSYDSDLCYCDDEEINQGGGLCGQCKLDAAIEELEQK